MSVKFIANGHGEPSDVIVEASEETWRKFVTVLRELDTFDMFCAEDDDAVLELVDDIREAGRN